MPEAASAPVVAAVERLATEALGAGGDPHAAQVLVSDCLRVTYRLLFAELARRRGASATSRAVVASLELQVLPPSVLRADVLVRVAALLCVLETPVEPVTSLGAIHEEVLSREPVVDDGRLVLRPGATSRKVAGSYFTPPSLVRWLLDRTLEPTLDEKAPAQVAVCDPSCGAGAFLVAATRKMSRRGLPPGEAVSRVVGVDTDQAALELARVCLWLELVESGQPVAMPLLRLFADDALLGDWTDRIRGDGFDVVVGNPPFLNQLERLTSHGSGASSRLNALSEGVLRPYTDVSAVFLQRAAGWVRPGGRIGLVQPQSLLAARDAAGVRDYVARSCAMEAIWVSDVPVFDAHVLTCAPVLRRDAAQGAVRRFAGPAFEELDSGPAPSLLGGWSFLVAPALGIPEVSLSDEHGVLGDLADCTADFRDQYYGLAPYVHEAPQALTAHLAPLVTSGLIDPAVSRWGSAPTRFLKRRWVAPVIDLDALRTDEKLHRWALRRLVPKVLVGTQGKVIEAVADEEGLWLPSVPVITVVPAEDRMWHVLAVLLAPPVAAHAAATFAGTALSMRAIKLSAKQVAALPLPPDQREWELGAAAVRRAQREGSRRREHLRAAAEHMCAAYGAGDAVLDWWLDRA